MYTLSFFVFLWHLIRFWSINKAVDYLSQKYKDNNFKIRFLWKHIYILQDQDSVRDVLNKNNYLPFMNKNFNLHLNINTVDSDSQLWRDMHNFLSCAVEKNKDKLPGLFQKHRGLLMQDKEFHDNLEDFLLHVWSEFTFGPDMTVKLYGAMRKLVLKTSRFVFYRNKLAYIPFVGWWTTKLYKFLMHSELDMINALLKNSILQIAQNQRSCMIGEYYSKMQEKYGNKAMEYTLGNAYLSFLVYDFVYGILLDMTLRLGAEPQINLVTKLLADEKEKNKYIYDSVKNMFMFPFRFRIIKDNYEGKTQAFKKGDYCLLNLKKAGEYFSYGPRHCVGYKMFPNIMTGYLELFKDCDLITQPIEIVRWPDINIPMIVSNHTVSIIHQADFKAVIPSYEAKIQDKSRTVYDVVDIYRQPKLVRALASKIANIFRAGKFEAIVVPEARGLPLAGMVLAQLEGDEPLVFIRKPGKLPGKTYSSGEYKTAYSTDILEISDESQYDESDKRKLRGKQAMLIDDGVASFGTNFTCIKLAEKCGSTVGRIITFNNYNYAKKIDEFRGYEEITSSFFEF
jgi:adenine/guanine phosphoribosyltransferase-like PRPP-binding protein